MALNAYTSKLTQFQLIVVFGEIKVVNALSSTLDFSLNRILIDSFLTNLTSAKLPFILKRMNQKKRRKKYH